MWILAITAAGILGVPSSLYSVCIWVRDVCLTWLSSHCMHCSPLSSSDPPPSQKSPRHQCAKDWGGQEPQDLSSSYQKSLHHEKIGG